MGTTPSVHTFCAALILYRKMYTRTHARHPRTRTHTHIHAHTHTSTHTHTHPLTHAHIHARTHTSTHARTRTRTQLCVATLELLDTLVAQYHQHVLHVLMMRNLQGGRHLEPSASADQPPTGYAAIADPMPSPTLTVDSTGLRGQCVHCYPMMVWIG